MHRSVAKIIFWWHDHMPRAHNIHVMYNFEHHSSQVAAEWGVCVVIADVRHTVKNVCFSTIVQKLLTLLFSPFTQTWLTIWPSKKHKSHTDINLKKFNLFCPLSLHTFWHLVIYVICVWLCVHQLHVLYEWVHMCMHALFVSQKWETAPFWSSDFWLLFQLWWIAKHYQNNAQSQKDQGHGQCFDR